MSYLNKVKNVVAIGVLSASTLFATSAFSEPGRVIAVTGDNYIWGIEGNTVVFDPDSGGPNITCTNYGRVAGTVFGTSALIAMKYDQQFTSVDMVCNNNYTQISVSRAL